MFSKSQRWLLILILLLAAFSAFLVTNSALHPTAAAYSAGPPAGYTRAPGEEPEACAECHVPEGGTGSGQISINVPSTYVPGQTYQIAVTSTNPDPSRRRWGFELTALDPADEKAGNLQSINPLTQVITGGPGGARQYIEHSASGTFPGQTGGAQWVFNWTAPPTNVGPVTFYAAGNHANNDGNTSGDLIYFTVNQSQPAAPTPPVVSFSTTAYSVNEIENFLSITVNRAGDTSVPVTVKYSTSDATDVNFNCNPNTAGQITGAASRKCDYHIASGRLRFVAGETSKQIVLSVINDVYVESGEHLTISLSSPTGASLGSPSTADVIITDNDMDTPGQPNPIDGTGFYVRMLYVDLLSREPDPAGFAGWVHRIDFCGQPGEPPPPCDRVTVGGDGFLRSAEFFDREFFVIRLYRTGLGRILFYDDVGDLAYVSGFLTSGDLELNKQELVSEIMSRPEFGNIYNALGNAQFVDRLIQTAAVTIATADRDAWVNALNTSSKTRAVVFREISERPEVSNKYLHEAQVVSCYYGFFTRNPDGAYFTYLQRLDNGEITLGDLANAFINAAEYRQRFGP
jgi:Calx-beta domain